MQTPSSSVHSVVIHMSTVGMSATAFLVENADIQTIRIIRA